MKNFVYFIIPAVVLVVVVWFIWFKPAAMGPEETAPVTDVPVHVGRIIRTSLHSYISAYGTVSPEPAGMHAAASAHVAPALPGVIMKVLCHEGQHVSRGDVLFRLDNRTAKVAVEYAEKTVQRQKKLLQVDGTSQKVLQAAEQQLADARARQSLLTVRSPLDGTVTIVNVRVGEAVGMSTILADVMDLDRLVVDARVPASELSALATGQAADVVTDSSNKAVTGRLIFIGSEVAADNGTVTARISLASGSGLRPGQFVHVRIMDQEHDNCLAVPEASVVHDEDGATVIAIVQNGTALQKVVKTGLREGGLVEVQADGLQPDMAVVTEGAYALPRETRVRVLEN